MGKWGNGGVWGFGEGASFWKREFQVEERVDVEPTVECANRGSWKSAVDAVNG